MMSIGHTLDGHSTEAIDASLEAWHAVRHHRRLHLESAKCAASKSASFLKEALSVGGKKREFLDHVGSHNLGCFSLAHR